MIRFDINRLVYTVIRNISDHSVIVNMPGTASKVHIGAKSAQAFPGYLTNTLDSQRALAGMLNSKGLQIYLAVKTADGVQYIRLSSKNKKPITDAVIAEKFSDAVPAQASAESPKDTQDRSVQPSTGSSSSAIKTSSLIPSLTGEERQFNVKASGSVDIMKAYGAIVVQEFGAAPAAKTDAAAETPAVEEHAVQPAETADQDEVTVSQVKYPQIAQALQLDTDALKDLIDRAFADKKSDYILDVISAKWPGLEFTKRALMNCKSFQNIVSKYKLV